MYYLPFMDDKMKYQSLSNLIKVTQVINGKSGTQVQFQGHALKQQVSFLCYFILSMTR